MNMSCLGPKPIGCGQLDPFIFEAFIYALLNFISKKILERIGAVQAQKLLTAAYLT